MEKDNYVQLELFSDSEELFYDLEEELFNEPELDFDVFKWFVKENFIAFKDVLSSPITYSMKLREQHGNLKSLAAGASMVAAPIGVAALTMVLEGRVDLAVIYGMSAWNAESIVSHVFLHPVPALN